MAADPGEAIANALATYLTTQSASMVESFTATAPDQPTVEREGTAVSVQCVPARHRHQKITRGGKTLDVWGVRVLITDNLDDGRERDSQIENEIRQAIKGEPQAGYSFSGIETEVEFDVAHLREMDQFTGILRAEYSGIS